MRKLRDCYMHNIPIHLQACNVVYSLKARLTYKNLMPCLRDQLPSYTSLV